MARNKNNKVKMYKVNDKYGFMTAEEIMNSDDEQLQEDFYHYLDKLNEQESRCIDSGVYADDIYQEDGSGD